MKRNIITSVIISLSVCLFAVGCGDVDTVECPDLVGKSYSYVSGAEQYSDIVFHVTYDKSDRDDDGKILSQDIEPGTAMPRGGTISIHISLGREKTAVPDVTGLGSEEACKKISDAGFNPVVVYSANSDYGDGKCYGTLPAAGSEAATGSDISVCISLGEKRNMIKHINLKGKDEQSAKDAIIKAGLSVGRVTYREPDEGEPAGTVIEQYPGYASSVEIAEGSKVDIVIAK